MVARRRLGNRGGGYGIENILDWRAEMAFGLALSRDGVALDGRDRTA